MGTDGEEKSMDSFSLFVGGKVGGMVMVRLVGVVGVGCIIISKGEREK